jgi:hypothetical protein
MVTEVLIQQQGALGCQLEIVLSTYCPERTYFLRCPSSGTFEAEKGICHHYILPAQPADSEIVALGQIAP